MVYDYPAKIIGAFKKWKLKQTQKYQQALNSQSTNFADKEFSQSTENNLIESKYDKSQSLNKSELASDSVIQIDLDKQGVQIMNMANQQRKSQRQKYRKKVKSKLNGQILDFRLKTANETRQVSPPIIKDRYQQQDITLGIEESPHQQVQEEYDNTLKFQGQKFEGNFTKQRQRKFDFKFERKQQEDPYQIKFI
ncbi:UNKNOWN [Stylonychia lemnae]|uniref:Uncharacterized protein n=1 Tax=Stylonychia lemnae TaxID=5949 RepID=A0A078ANB0_STYLE|nr:UNKNOWN [Stylonychia lemnae]|eukprot:CDW83855.1 UNKNOWN [Stylonychia lemnae]